MNYHLVPLKNDKPVKGLCITKLKRNVEATVFLQACRDMERYKRHNVDVDSIEIYKGDTVDNLQLKAIIYG
ncbi:MAG: hypothetical protein IKN15_12750 [Bacteroidaceae bacterium]|nr:hypothetical protein [Bacteroidaceae bacterium]